ncbi:hypothetical protein AWZ03_012898 [Drosophila navojoa]|uniref:Uncharacterized protein n=1 Tax=Drosophila navojoa TaxID=7232 RepID=A0A484AXW2_DRONA|nr:hypothetical protein AWZ03_012898 [Drosophila navojoa]
MLRKLAEEPAAACCDKQTPTAPAASRQPPAAPATSMPHACAFVLRASTASQFCRQRQLLQSQCHTDAQPKLARNSNRTRRDTRIVQQQQQQQKQQIVGRLNLCALCKLQ